MGGRSSHRRAIATLGRSPRSTSRPAPCGSLPFFVLEFDLSYTGHGGASCSRAASPLAPPAPLRALVGLARRRVVVTPRGGARRGPGTGVPRWSRRCAPLALALLPRRDRHRPHTLIGGELRLRERGEAVSGMSFFNIGGNTGYGSADLGGRRTVAGPDRRSGRIRRDRGRAPPAQLLLPRRAALAAGRETAARQGGRRLRDERFAVVIALRKRRLFGSLMFAPLALSIRGHGRQGTRFPPR